MYSHRTLNRIAFCWAPPIFDYTLFILEHLIRFRCTVHTERDKHYLLLTRLKCVNNVQKCSYKSPHKTFHLYYCTWHILYSHAPCDSSNTRRTYFWFIYFVLPFKLLFAAVVVVACISNTPLNGSTFDLFLLHWSTWSPMNIPFFVRSLTLSLSSVCLLMDFPLIAI